MEDDRIGAALIGAVPEMAGLLESHRSDDGRVRPHELFGSALRFGVHEWRQGRPEIFLRIVAFMDEAFTGADARAADAVASGFVAPIAAARPHPDADTVVAALTPALRGELERQRSAKRLIADGVWIEFPDGEPHLTTIWAIRDTPETMACDGDVVYLVGDAVHAVDVVDGRYRWRYDGHDGSPLHGSGGVTIATMPDGTLEIFAPYEYRVRLDPHDGEEVAWGPAPSSDDEPGGSAFPDFPVRNFDLTVGDGGSVRIATRDGDLLATVTIEAQHVDPLPAMQVGDVLIVALTSGDVLGLRRTGAT